MQNGKGSKRRPMQIPQDEYISNWDEIDWGPHSKRTSKKSKKTPCKQSKEKLD